jgi:DMSO reductase family type II enzyme chaperone
MQTPSEKMPATLQNSIDQAVARSFIYRFIAKGFEDPSPENWSRLTDARLQQSFRLSVQGMEPCKGGLIQAAHSWLELLNAEAFSDFKLDYDAAFGHGARGLCPINEIEYGELKADPLFQPHRLADLAAFYHAFGLEVGADAGERHDHICLELEFMSVLAAKEAYALEIQLDDEQLSVCRNAQKNFLREHLGRWIPAFGRRLAHLAGKESSLAALANFTQTFIVAECVDFGVAPGDEDLLLRPVDTLSETLCQICGLGSPFPGALQMCGES